MRQKVVWDHNVIIRAFDIFDVYLFLCVCVKHGNYVLVLYYMGYANLIYDLLHPRIYNISNKFICYLH